MHRSCVEQVLKINNVCPLCKQKVNPDSLITRKERLITEFKHMAIDASHGTAIESIREIMTLLSNPVKRQRR